MKYQTTTIALVGLLLVGPALPAAAQDPDLRDILPYLMLVVDTSGSMERRPACQCTTPACTECLPDCDNADLTLKKNRWAVALEALTGTINNFECEPLERTAANGMTYDLGYYAPYHQPWDCLGEAPGAACAPYDGTSTCNDDTDCAAGDPNFPICDTTRGQCAAFTQQTNGVLDSYSTRIRFGLMAFDGWDTYVGAPPLVPVADFDTGLSESEQGLWSYAGAKSFHYPNCVTDYMMDTGARSSVATEGELISINACDGPTCPSWCPACPIGNEDILSPSNNAIQEALLRARPYGGTPIAASLDDLYYHYTQDLTDTFGACRNRYALLITDGYPDEDYRDFDCDCAETGTPSDPDYWKRCDPVPPALSTCTSDPTSCANHPTLMHCPYPSPEDAAFDLAHGRDGDDPQLEKLFVVGLAIDDDNVIDKLNAIAEAGGVEDDPDDADTHAALFADDINQLLTNLSNVFDALIDPISRSVPVFATAGTLDRQYQISTGFEISTGPGQPWTGIIERRKFECDSNGLLDDDIDITDAERFHLVLNGSTGDGTSRRLLTAVPPATPYVDSVQAAGYLRKEVSTTCGVDGCVLRTLDDGNIQPEIYGLTAGDQTAKTNLMNWMYGRSGVRAGGPQGKRLGDIYHSQPVIVGTPQLDTGDEAFNEFRVSPIVNDRPMTVYVSSNDGIIHAFALEDYTLPTEYAHLDGGITPARNLVTGQEIFGFVPPFFLGSLANNLTGHQYLTDGSPVVKDVFFSKVTTADADPNTYHTLLVTGMRKGGPSYVALDVTNPFNPKFLWQFADPVLGNTYGRPAIVQALYERDTGGAPPFDPVQRAVVVLPGGTGAIDQTQTVDCDNPPNNQVLVEADSTAYDTIFPQLSDPPTEVLVEHRRQVRCWTRQGRALYFVDAEDGRVIKEIKDKSDGTPFFPAPLVGTPAMYPTDTGTLASRGFVIDAEGVLWRIDMSSTDPVPDDPFAGWTARPFHDVFYDLLPNGGELTYEEPILSVDDEGQLVVLLGTGDTDNFIKPSVENRVVSLIEREIHADPDNPDFDDPTRWKAQLNWEVRDRAGGVGTHSTEMEPSELVTGPMSLYNGVLYFATFIPISGSGDACDLGKGRLHAVDYIEPNPNVSYTVGSVSTYAPQLEVVTESGSATEDVLNVLSTAAVENFMVLGLNLTQRPTCSVVDALTYDVYTGTQVEAVASSPDQPMYLVAQASGDATQVAERAQSLLGSIELEVEKPEIPIRVTSFATTVE